MLTTYTYMRNKKTYTVWDIEQLQQQQQQQQQQQSPTSQNFGSAMAADIPVPSGSDYDLLQPGFR